MSRCVICGSGEVPKGNDAHRLCAERKARGVPTPPLPALSYAEVKLIDGQLFEKTGGKWRKIL